MRLLIPVFSPASGTWGGITRVIAVAEAARRAGHEVALCASGDLEPRLRQRGYTVYSNPAATMFGLPAPISRVIARRGENFALPVQPGRSIGNIWFVFFVSGMARSGYLHALVDAELQAVRAFKPDRLFTDLNPGAYLVARITGLPIAAAFQQVMTWGKGSWAWGQMHRAMMSVLNARGCPAADPDDLCFGPSVLKIIPSIPELDGADPARRDVCYVGQLLGDIQPTGDLQLEARRHVFVYVGTGSIGLTTLREVLPRVFPESGERRCLVGAPGIAQPERVGGVEFRPYVAVEDVLPRCDWTICHGGQNTIVQSLRQGVPLIIFPGPIFERRFNAQKVQEAGAGLMSEVTGFTIEWLTGALQRQAEFVPRAAALGERIRSYGGAAAAVEAIERHTAAAPSAQEGP